MYFLFMGGKGMNRWQCVLYFIFFSFGVVSNLLFNTTSGQVSFSFFCPAHVSKTCHTTWCNQQSAHRRPRVWNSRSFAAWSWMVLAELFEEVCLVPACIVLSQFQRGCCLYLVRMTFSQNSQGIMYLLIWNAANALYFRFLLCPFLYCWLESDVSNCSLAQGKFCFFTTMC